MDGTADTLDLVRQLLDAAPPGRLQTVLRNLRVLLDDDTYFFLVIPPLCLNYHLQHYTVMRLPILQLEALPHVPSESKAGGTAASDTAGSLASVACTTTIMCGWSTHLLTWVRLFGQHRPRRTTPDADPAAILVWEDDPCRVELEQYFQGLPSKYIAEDRAGVPEVASQSDEDLFSAMQVSYGFEHLQHVFFDLAHRVYVEVDPVEERCVRVISFGQRSNALPEALAALEGQLTGEGYGLLGHLRFRLQDDLRSITTVTDVPVAGAGFREPSRDGRLHATSAVLLPCAPAAAAGDGENEAWVLHVLVASQRGSSHCASCTQCKTLFAIRCVNTQEGADELSVPTPYAVVEGETIVRLFADGEHEAFHHKTSHHFAERVLPQSLPCEVLSHDEKKVGEGSSCLEGSPPNQAGVLLQILGDHLEEVQQQLQRRTDNDAHASWCCSRLKRPLPFGGRLFVPQSPAVTVMVPYSVTGGRM